ncbi:MAG: tRNA dihydrouridine(20/20a) synthase DusA [Saccharospirillum sp.]|nr:tRNA dihydrouridine(20/20a) synthase DusA [Saccharospirillum sp.]
MPYPHRFSVAPMMDWTTSTCRQFHRLFTSNALLYTEMVTTGAIIHGGAERFLRYDDSEHPLALQLGGSDAKELGHCAKLANDWGYDEVNLNAGCPSDRVQNGMIGAILMGHSRLVADAIAAMRDASDVPVTIKHRLGIDDLDSYEFLRDFVGTVAEAGCNTFIVHARKAILKGLSPKENRDIPPLDYQRVKRLKQEMPHLNIILNGGLKDHQHCLSLLADGIDGVMMGREAYQNPWLLQQVDALYYDRKPPVSEQAELVDRYLQWIQQGCRSGTPLKHLARHGLGLFQGQPGAKRYRRLLSEGMHHSVAGPELMQLALSQISLRQGNDESPNLLTESITTA